MSGHLWEPFSEQNFADPYPMYNRLREKDPVHHAQTGEWVITRHQHNVQILKDSRFKAGNRSVWLKKEIEYLGNKDIDLQAIAEAISTFVLLLNPPQHTHIRRFIAKAWDDREVEGLIKENVALLLEKTGNGSFDLVSDFAEPLPALTITRILGLPLEDYQELKEWAGEMVKALDPYTSVKKLVLINKTARNFIDYFHSSIAQKERDPGPDLMSKMIRLNQSQEEPLSLGELVSICIFLFVAGEETTVNFISTSLLNLIRNPGQMSMLKNNPENFPQAIEELLRFGPPVHLIGRYVEDDIDFEGKVIGAGDVITLCLAAANRDPEVFDDPDRLSLDRDPANHLAFGSGIHRCLGDWLARIQGRVALESLLERYDHIRLADQKLEWRDMLAIRGLKRLKLEID